MQIVTPKRVFKGEFRFLRSKKNIKNIFISKNIFIFITGEKGMRKYIHEIKRHFSCNNVQ